MANTKIAQEIRDLCNKFMLKGHSAAETRKRVYALNYDPPTIKTILQWFHEDYPDKVRVRQKKMDLCTFTPTKRVKAWLRQQSSPTQAVNTIIEWYLRELQLEKKRERDRQRYHNRFKTKDNQNIQSVNE